MVYIAPDGSMHETRPWSLGRITDIFWGTVNFITQFFQTLFGFTNDGAITGRGGNRQGGRGGTGNDGPGGPGGPGGRPPRRFATMKEVQDCSMPGGG